jgi:hypothetical protein
MGEWVRWLAVHGCGPGPETRPDGILESRNRSPLRGGR